MRYLTANLFLLISLPLVLACKSTRNAGTDVVGTVSAKKENWAWIRIAELDIHGKTMIPTISSQSEYIFFQDRKSTHSDIYTYSVASAKWDNYSLKINSAQPINLAFSMMLKSGVYALASGADDAHGTPNQLLILRRSISGGGWDYQVSQPQWWRDNSARYDLMSEGKILLSGGVRSRTFLQTSACELYVTDVNRWIAVSPMLAARSGHLSFATQDGRVVVIGGEGLFDYSRGQAPPFPFAEIYDPLGDFWKEALSIPQHIVKQFYWRWGDSFRKTCKLSDGTFVVPLTKKDYEKSSVLLFDSKVEKCHLNPNIDFDCRASSAVTLSSGKVLIAGEAPFLADGLRTFLYSPPSDWEENDDWIEEITFPGQDTLSRAQLPHTIARYELLEYQGGGIFAAYESEDKLVLLEYNKR